MSDQGKLIAKQIVWVRAQPQSWWPGKIVKIMSQNSKKIFKIALFADSKYTYLPAHQLRPFEEVHQQLTATSLLDQRLKKAIQMAVDFDLATTKSNYNAFNPFKTDEEELISLQNREVNDALDEIIKPQNNASQNEVYSQTEQQNELRQWQIDEVNTENIFEIIQNNRKHHNNIIKKLNYCYEDRKFEINFQNRLKHVLLLKYNLHSISNKQDKKDRTSLNKKQIITIKSAKNRTEKRKMIHKNMVNRPYLNCEIDVLRVKCLKKINSVLKNTSDSIETVKLQAIDTMRRILILSDNNSKKLQSLFVTLIRNIGGYSPLVSCGQRLADFNHFLQRLENEKHQDEEGSKITQIEALN